MVDYERQPSIASRTSSIESITSRCALAAVGAAAMLHYSLAASGATKAADLADLSLEQLGDIVVTSVSRHEERLSQAPASIYVITTEDIRRSGANTLPEVLRLAPNLQVNRADTTQYAISARGFNNVLANKLLVMIDGRVVYSPLFSGVFWEAQDVLLEDVERIEVISGPGTTIWGANAVNGVINIITRPAQHTQGGMVSIGAGTIERGGAARYGAKLGEGFVRFYGKYFDQDNSETTSGSQIRDAAYHWQAGFRADWPGTDQDFTMQGDAYRGNIDQLPSGRDISGANVLGRWIRRFDDDSSLRLQAFYDHTSREQPGFEETLDTVDLEMQHRFRTLTRHQIDWGGGYRRSADRVETGPAFTFDPANKDLDWANVFVQDEIQLASMLALTVGAKLERNEYTGWEFLPNIRLAWRAAPSHFFWAAASRAVRAPSRVDRDFFVPARSPFVIAGGPNFDSEVADVLEVGYRAEPFKRLSLSVTAFYNDFDRLRSLETRAGGAQVANRIEGSSVGVEAWGSYRITEGWRLTGGAVILDERLHRISGSTDVAGLPALGNDPEYWWSVRSLLDVTEDVQFDVSVRRVGSLPNPRVPSYTAFDARLGWRPSKHLDFSLSFRNLFDPEHVEWGVPANRAQFGRAVFFRISWQS